MTVLNHVCFPVKDLERSLTFYREALGLTPQREMDVHDGTGKLVFLGDGMTEFRLELSWESVGDNAHTPGDHAHHVGLITEEYDTLHAKHEAMGCIAGEDPSLGIYFLEDPDGHRIELVPKR